MLQGKKVILRAVTREDLPRLCEFNNSLAVELAGGGDPPMPKSFDRFEAEYNSNISRGGRDGAQFVIEADGSCIGQCGLFNVDETAHTCELGIGIGDTAYWGRGYGREALKLLVDYGFRHRNLHKIWLRVNANNERAYRAYRACGFVEEGRLRNHVWNDGAYRDLVCMGILREEWAGDDR